MRFPATSWSLLAEASARDETSRAALNQFAELYHRAICAYIGAIVGSAADADDISQRFFLDVVLTGRLFAGADRQKGSFRPYLKAVLRNFIVDDMRRRSRQAERPGTAALHPDGMPGGWDFVADARPAPDAAFHRQWSRDLVRVALDRVRERCRRRGQDEHFQLFVRRFLAEGDELPSWRDLGARFGLDEKTARSRAETVIRQFRTTLRALVSEGTGDGAVDEEIQALIALADAPPPEASFAKDDR